MAGNSTETDITAAFAAYGYEMGCAFAAMLDGFTRGFADQRGTADSEPTAEKDATEPVLKTDIRDCRACWCDTCARLDECAIHREGESTDGIRPLPCIGCINGMRFMDKKHEPNCGLYEETDSPNNG